MCSRSVFLARNLKTFSKRTYLAAVLTILFLSVTLEKDEFFTPVPLELTFWKQLGFALILQQIPFSTKKTPKVSPSSTDC